MAPPAGEQEGARGEQGGAGRELIESPEDGTHLARQYNGSFAEAGVVRGPAGARSGASA